MNWQKVFLILEPEFHGDLWALSRESHVWLLGSAYNMALARAVWDREPSTDRDLMATGVSTFEGTPERIETFYRILGTIDDHHSEYTTTPWGSIHVLGLPFESVSPAQVAEALGEDSIRVLHEGEDAWFGIERAAQRGDAPVGALI